MAQGIGGPLGDRTGVQQVIPYSSWRRAAADDGQYFVANTPTAATGIAANVTMLTTYEATRPFIVIQNGNTVSAGVGKRIQLDFLRLRCNAAGASSTATRLHVEVDDTSRYTSGGSAITPVNSNMADTTTSGAVIKMGAITCPAAGANVRVIVNSHVLRPVIPVVGDVYIATFGADEFSPNSLAPAGTAIAYAHENFPPVAVGPNQWIVINVWNPGNITSGVIWEVLLGYRER